MFFNKYCVRAYLQKKLLVLMLFKYPAEITTIIKNYMFR